MVTARPSLLPAPLQRGSPLWAVWQRNHRDEPQYSLDENLWDPDPHGCDMYPNTFVPRNDPMAGGATPGSMVDHLTLRYFYRRDNALEAEGTEILSGDTGARLLAPRTLDLGPVYLDRLKVRVLGIGNSGPDDIDVAVDGDWTGEFFGSNREGRIRPCGRLEVPNTFVPSGGATSQPRHPSAGR